MSSQLNEDLLLSKPCQNSNSSNSYKRSFFYSKWSEKFRNTIRLSRRSIVVKMICCTLLYAAFYNSVAYLVYGKNHPLNRHNWRKMERNGQLDKNLIEKKKQLDAYLYEVINQGHFWKWENDKHPNVFSFNSLNFD